MAKPYSEELVYATTEDGLLLEGVVLRPTESSTRLTRPVGIVWIHGNAASFCAPSYVRIGRALAMLGYPVVIGNTRGHDIAAMLWRSEGGAMPAGGGAGWERLEDAPRDLAAWVNLAAEYGANRVVLAGHSSGCQRVVLYQAERQDDHVAGLVLASPDLRGFFPPGELEAAQRLVAEGHGQEVTPAQPYAPWYRQSAQSVVSKAAILARMLEADDGEPTIAAIRCPLLALVGTREPHGETLLEVIRRQTQAAHIQTELIADADHFYTGHEADVAAVIGRWIDGLTG